MNMTPILQSCNQCQHGGEDWTCSAKFPAGRSLVTLLSLALLLLASWAGCQRESGPVAPNVGDRQGKTAGAEPALPAKEPSRHTPELPQDQAVSARGGKANRDALQLELKGSTEWQAGDEILLELAITNSGGQPLENINLEASIQFGLQDSISEGRWHVPLGQIAGGQSLLPTFRFLSTKPGVWYAKAALYHEGELIKATTRTIYVREPRQTPTEEPKDDEAALGPPLVENPDRLQRLHPEFPIWLDAEGKAVVMIGRVCQRQAPLELFACLKNSKEHESVLSINTRAYIVHAGLLALGLEPGRPVQFYPEYRPAEGPEIEITLAWRDADGQVRTALAQQWVRNVQTREPLAYPWIFTGSQLLKDEETGKQYYYADSTGELICVSNFPSAVLDLPIRSTDSNEALLFEAFTENIPPLGTPVTVILRPKSTSEAGSQAPNAPPMDSPETQPVREIPTDREDAGRSPSAEGKSPAEIQSPKSVPSDERM